ncbi:MAG: S1C family serine protease [Clostridia bacterium]|nr:S1C family serine protease [Clostridia bacterium]
MKKFLTIFASFCAAAVMLFSGCTLFSGPVGEAGQDGQDGLDGRDGKDGTSVSIYDAYEELKKTEGNESLTFDEFLKIYLSYSGTQADAAASLQATMNRSLMSAVTILTRFKYKSSGLFSSYTYKIFTGSGVVLWADKAAGDAYVVTNCHVVYDDTSVDSNYISEYVRLYLYGQDVKGTNFSYPDNYSEINDYGFGINAQVIGASVTYDIALLKVTNSDVIKRSDVTAANFSDDEDVYIGESVYAVGNAAGEGMSVADGVISKDSEFISLNLSDANSNASKQYRVMRTTAPINHGNSGGGLFNTDGKIVGIVNAKDDEADADNLGYVLPASYVKRLLKLMYDDYSGHFSMGVNKAFLGVETTVTDSYARYDSDKGLAVITEITKVKNVTDSPAFGKLLTGDIFRNVRIVDSDGNEKENLDVTREYHVRDVMFSVRQGDTVYITVERLGMQREVEIKFNNSAYFKATG